MLVSNKVFVGYAEKQFYECTEVEFGDLTDDVILAYIESGEPLYVLTNLIFDMIFTLCIFVDYHFNY